MVKSKWGLALAAVVTVLSSLLMSVGLCTLFGLTPTLNGGYEIIQYTPSYTDIMKILSHYRAAKQPRIETHISDILWCYRWNQNATIDLGGRLMCN